MGPTQHPARAPDSTAPRGRLTFWIMGLGVSAAAPSAPPCCPPRRCSLRGTARGLRGVGGAEPRGSAGGGSPRLCGRITAPRGWRHGRHSAPHPHNSLTEGRAPLRGGTTQGGTGPSLASPEHQNRPPTAHTTPGSPRQPPRPSPCSWSLLGRFRRPLPAARPRFLKTKLHTEPSSAILRRRRRTEWPQRSSAPLSAPCGPGGLGPRGERRLLGAGRGRAPPAGGEGDSRVAIATAWGARAPVRVHERARQYAGARMCMHVHEHFSTHS